METNNRFDTLTNSDIFTHYQNYDFRLMKSYFLGAFAYWVIVQSPYDCPDISKAMKAFDIYISEKFYEKEMVIKFTQTELCEFINGEVFEKIPEIEILNHAKIPSKSKYLFTSRFFSIKPDYDFISLGALSRNITYMLMREYITQNH